MTYTYEGVLSKFYLKGSLYLGMLRELSTEAYPRAVYLIADKEFPLLNVEGNKDSVFLCEPTESTRQGEKKYFTHRLIRALAMSYRARVI